ncbi:MAG: methyltransferase [Spirochaetes bacterium GWF1_51_8]|nr:MAG: methyltransferase [Spirochaetes bacterium GWF1_51_8]
MFSEIGAKMLERMRYLEEKDRIDRVDGTARLERLRQVPPETGRFLAILASNCPEGEFAEIGTSAGYSAMWISLAAKERGIKLKTYELLEEKIRLAKETFASAGIENYVELIEGNALEHIGDLGPAAFCFLDTEKELYLPCWDILSGKIVPHGIFAADNAINHYETVKPMIEKARNDIRFDCTVVPVGHGVLVCRRK